MGQLGSVGRTLIISFSSLTVAGAMEAETPLFDYRKLFLYTPLKQIL